MSWRKKYAAQPRACSSYYCFNLKQFFLCLALTLSSTNLRGVWLKFRQVEQGRVKRFDWPILTWEQKKEYKRLGLCLVYSIVFYGHFDGSDNECVLFCWLFAFWSQSFPGFLFSYVSPCKTFSLFFAFFSFGTFFLFRAPSLAALFFIVIPRRKKNIRKKSIYTWF